MSGGRFQYDSVRTEAYAAAATAVAVDYVGDQEVRLDRSMSLSQSSTHHDVSMVPDSMFHDVVNEVRVDQYDGPGWSVTGGATLSSDESMTVNYPAETCSYARTSDEATVEHDLLYVDLRHGEYLYVERRHGRVDSGTATNPGVSCAGAATATTTARCWRTPPTPRPGLARWSPPKTTSGATTTPAATSTPGSSRRRRIGSIKAWRGC